MTDKEKFRYIALLYYNHIMDGDHNTDEFLEFMEQEGLLDENGEWIYDKE